MANVYQKIWQTNPKESGASYCQLIQLHLHLHFTREHIMTLREKLSLPLEAGEDVTPQELLHVVLIVAAAILNPG